MRRRVSGCQSLRKISTKKDEGTDRRTKKRDFRKLWIMRINAAVREHGLTYSKFIAALKENQIEINRKSLAHMAVHESEMFSELVKSISK